nr:hypothetical protein [uncultured bacterium]
MIICYTVFTKSAYLCKANEKSASDFVGLFSISTSCSFKQCVEIFYFSLQSKWLCSLQYWPRL